MAGWAQVLQDVIDRRLRPDGATPLTAPSWDTMFDEAFAEVMGQMLAARLEALTPEQFVAAYRSVNGDAALLAELERVVDSRSLAARREQARAELGAEATVAGRLRLGGLDAGETLDIGLFDPTDPQLACWRCRDNTDKRPLHRVLRVRLTAPATGAVQVVADRWTGAVWAERWRTPPIAPMASARIGTAVGDGLPAAPELTVHAPLVATLDDGSTLTPPQIVGYVRTRDGLLLLDA